MNGILMNVYPKYEKLCTASGFLTNIAEADVPIEFRLLWICSTRKKVYLESGNMLLWATYNTVSTSVTFVNDIYWFR